MGNTIAYMGMLLLLVTISTEIIEDIDEIEGWSEEAAKTAKEYVK